jgi:hypothetical protein
MIRRGAPAWVVMLRRTLFSASLLAAVALVGFALSASGQGASGGDVGVVALSTSDVDAVAATGSGWVRLSSTWSLLEPTNGVYAQGAWNSLEARLRHAKSLGLKVQLTLTGSPAWATNESGSGATPTPANYGRYAQFLGDLAHRLAPYVDAWVVWNEPNHPFYWQSPNPAAYAQLQKDAYPAIKAQDPSSVVLLAPIAPTGPGIYGVPGSGSINPYDYLQSLYDNGIRGYYDAVAWNLYPPGAPEDTFVDSSGRPYAGSFPGQLYAHSLIQANDPGKHVWITEFGWSTCISCSLNLINGVDEATQADYLSRAWTYERRYLPWVDVMFWFEASDSNSPSTWERGLGLIRPDGSHKPSYQSLIDVANQRGGSGGGGGGGTGTTGTTGGGGGGGSKPPKAAKVCTVPAVVRSKGKVVLNVGAFTPKPHLGFFNLAFAVVTKSKKTNVVIDGQRGTKWLGVTTVKLKQSSKLRLKVRDRGYTMIRVRANSALGRACRSRAPVGLR